MKVSKWIPRKLKWLRTGQCPKQLRGWGLSSDSAITTVDLWRTLPGLRVPCPLWRKRRCPLSGTTNVRQPSIDYGNSFLRPQFWNFLTTREPLYWTRMRAMPAWALYSRTSSTGRRDHLCTLAGYYQKQRRITQRQNEKPWLWCKRWNGSNPTSGG